ncbi:MAG: PEGA domain-containing protein, partial [Planctomycetota bacterium]|nr:PEGA domain-containing protein [Planctomycetota bacterium]
MNNTIIAPLLLALLGAASCFSVQPAPTLSLSTHPPGALVLINGEETGFATPCILAVEEELIRVEIVL